MAAYRGVVQPESEDKRIISAQWAKDDDIARFLKALPNWQAVQEASHESITESPQDVDSRNLKEIGKLIHVNSLIFIHQRQMINLRVSDSSRNSSTSNIEYLVFKYSNSSSISNTTNNEEKRPKYVCIFYHGKWLKKIVKAVYSCGNIVLLQKFREINVIPIY